MFIAGHSQTLEWRSYSSIRWEFFFKKKARAKAREASFFCFTYVVQKEEMLSIKSYLRNWCLLQLTIGRDDNDTLSPDFHMEFFD